MATIDATVTATTQQPGCVGRMCRLSGCEEFHAIGPHSGPYGQAVICRVGCADRMRTNGRSDDEMAGLVDYVLEANPPLSPCHPRGRLFQRSQLFEYGIP